ncbi:hypothetical protein DL769_011081 [Monosporascus sp. CRB-8-3]|nr:hypothetical protein DL769_011081 [Monosporascus sp. CRB-8-3]
MIPSPVFAHDPEYELHDVRLLERLGFRVCNPYRQEGYTEVDGGTFVFSVADAASTAHYEEIVLLTTRPAAVMLLDARLEALPRGGSRLDVEEILAEEYSRAEGCDAIGGQSYRIVNLRYEERNLTPTSLYVRRPESEWGLPADTPRPGGNSSYDTPHGRVDDLEMTGDTSKADGDSPGEAPVPHEFVYDPDMEEATLKAYESPQDDAPAESVRNLETQG